MTKTANDVVKRALQIINVVGAQEEPSAEDKDTATDEYKAFHEVLQVQLRDTYKVSNWSWDYNSVEDEIYPHVSKMLAEYLTSTFSVSDNKYAMVVRGAARS
jgi:hypothetical protein